MSGMDQILQGKAMLIAGMVSLDSRKQLSTTELVEFLNRTQLAHPDEAKAVAEGIISRQHPSWLAGGSSATAQSCLSRAQFCHFLVGLGRKGEGGPELLEHIIERLAITCTTRDDHGEGGGDAPGAQTVTSMANRLFNVWSHGKEAGRSLDEHGLARVAFSMARCAGEDPRALPTPSERDALKRKLDYDKDGVVSGQDVVKALVQGFLVPRDPVEDQRARVRARGGEGSMLAAAPNVARGLARLWAVTQGEEYERSWQTLVGSWEQRHGGGLRLFK